MKMSFFLGHPSFLKVFFFFENISNESHQTQLDQKESKPIKTGGFTESVGWAHHNPPFYTPWIVSSSPFPPCPVSRWSQALAEGLKRNTSLQMLSLRGNKIGDSGAQARRQGSWRIGCRASEVAILRHFWDVWNLNHLISISILVGLLGATFGV